jgi:exopolysaccharide biosynthesis polyprenyl glycosylphosphotransferase
MTRQTVTKLRPRPEEPFGVSSPRLEVAGLSPVLPAGVLPIATEPPAATDSFFWSGTLHRRVLGVADMASTTLAIVAVLVLLGSNGAVVAALACVPLMLCLFKAGGLYARDELRLVRSTLEEAPRLLQLTGLLALGITILQPVVLPSRLAGLQIAALWIAWFAAVTGGRLMARWLAARFHPVERCLIVGDLDQANRVRERLAASRARAKVIACLPLSGDDLEELDSPTITSDLLRELNVHRLIVVPARTDTGGGHELIRMAKAAGVRVSVLQRIFDVIGSEVEFDEVNGLTLLGVRRFGLPRSSRLLKRAFDIVVTSIALVVIGPVIAVIALAIRLDSHGPVFFRQVRVGRDGRHFRMIKFRSMIADADALKDGLRGHSGPGADLFKLVDDPRVTRVGKFLRGSSLDELPQFFNVLRGEMSLVGARPLVIEEDALIVGHERSRLYIRPGMTGPWQILDVRLPLHEMIEVDYRYVANWSLWLDLKILLRTIPHVARRGNL